MTSPARPPGPEGPALRRGSAAGPPGISSLVDVSSLRREPDADPLFEAARHDLAAFQWRPEFQVETIPAPQRIAPYSAAVGADVAIDGTDVGTGKLILLHDPSEPPAWEGAFRLVTYARADVDLEMVSDPLLAEVAWSWLTEALETRGARYAAPSGTVTAVSSRCFGVMDGEPDRAEVEMRASWTLRLEGPGDFPAHVGAWQDLLCLTAGLSPLPEGIVSLSPRRAAR